MCPSRAVVSNPKLQPIFPSDNLNKLVGGVLEASITDAPLRDTS